MMKYLKINYILLLSVILITLIWHHINSPICLKVFRNETSKRCKTWMSNIYSSLIENNEAKSSQEKLKLSNFTSNKTILLWTYWETGPFNRFDPGDQTFINNNCSINNCFIQRQTGAFKNKDELKHIDAVLFHVPELQEHYLWDLLPKRTEATIHQKYVLVSLEAEQNYYLQIKRYDDYFNWTMTYKLNSDIPMLYFAVRDFKGNFIAPKQNVHWVAMVKPVGENFENNIKEKSLAAAWLASNCETNIGRELIVEDLQRALSIMKLALDKYGGCGSNCGTNCDEMIKKKYYFYLVFENALSDDYVTEKVMRAYNNFAVPIVYGKANYSKFLPPGSYLDARSLGIKATARAINKAIRHKNVYLEYFKWTNYYKFEMAEARSDTNFFCKLCENLNDEKLMNTYFSYSNIADWWHEGFTPRTMWKTVYPRTTTKPNYVIKKGFRFK